MKRFCVNSIRSREPYVAEFLDEIQPDVPCLQELKATAEQVPMDLFESRGYHVVLSGQKRWNGVLIASKRPISSPIIGFPGEEGEDARMIGATIDGFTIVNLYCPQGSSADSPKFAYKKRFYRALIDWTASQLEQGGQWILTGDFNIAPADEDVHDPEEWAGKILCSDNEREALSSLTNVGLKDCYRIFNQEKNMFSWWDYRAAGFRRNRGLRIDLILASLSLSDHCQKCDIDIAPRKLERPSDHTPVVAEFNI